MNELSETKQSIAAATREGRVFAEKLLRGEHFLDDFFWISFDKTLKTAASWHADSVLRRFEPAIKNFVENILTTIWHLGPYAVHIIMEYAMVYEPERFYRPAVYGNGALINKPVLGRKYHIKLVSAVESQPTGWYLEAHRYYSTDERNHHSTNLIIHEPKQNPGKGIWMFQEGSKPGMYNVTIESNHFNQPRKWFLAAHRAFKRDSRSEDSTYAIVHKDGAYRGQSWRCDWILEPGIRPGRFRIVLASSNNFGELQPAGWFLTAHRTAQIDKRNHHSTNVMVLRPDEYMVGLPYEAQWELEEVNWDNYPKERYPKHLL